MYVPYSYLVPMGCTIAAASIVSAPPEALLEDDLWPQRTPLLPPCCLVCGLVIGLGCCIAWLEP